jgi:hypothetical protein
LEKETLKSNAISAGTAIFEADNFVEPVFAVCINNEGNTASLERHKIYRVLPDAEALEDHELRVIDESGEDYLFPRDWFMFVELPENLKQYLLAA